MEPNELNQNVNLRFCTDCGNQYSRQAPACPRCGCPNKARDTGSEDPILWLPTILFPLFFILSKNKARAWTARILVALCVMGSIVGSMVISCALSSAFYGSTADDFGESVRVDCNGVTLEMVKIKAGSFLMGSPKRELGRDEWESQCYVTLTQDYWIGKFEVTQAQYEAIMGNNPSEYKGSNHPVERVNWYEAKAFCNKLNERYAGELPAGYKFDLPTEAQWEYACRAGTTTALNNGTNLTSKDKCSNLDEVAWYNGNCNSPQEVGQKRPNNWGLYDMLGNVGEWCRDGAPIGGNSVYYGRTEITDPVGSSQLPTCHGGCYISPASECRSASNGGYNKPSFGGVVLGFRLALVPVQ